MLARFPRYSVLAVAGAVLFYGLASPAMAAKRGRSDTSAGGGVPTLDIKSTCLEAQNYGSEDKRRAYQGCLEDEEQARQQLKAQWNKFSAKDKTNCVASTASVMPSYVEVLTCLEMSQENALPEYQPERKWPSYTTVPNPNEPSQMTPAEEPRYRSDEERILNEKSESLSKEERKHLKEKEESVKEEIKKEEMKEEQHESTTR